MSRQTYATIHTHALRHNLRRIREHVAPARVMALVKAEGYGHGLERAAEALADADAFGVATLQDAIRLRAAGFSQRVVLLEGFDHERDLHLIRRLGLDTVVHEDHQVSALEQDPAGAPISVWLKLDSGMHRLGFALDRARELHGRLSALPGVADLKLMSHFACAEGDGRPTAAEQLEAFAAATAGLPGERSLANSAALWTDPQTLGDWVRAGGLLYGLSPLAQSTGVDLGFKPAMTLSARLIAVKNVAAGGRIGYGGSFVADQDMPLGIAAIGYGDGYPRHAPSGTPVRVAGVQTQLVGRVSMDMIAIDLRPVPSAKVGDRVVLWGEGLPVERVARAAGTIGYELCCGMTRRIEYR